MSSRTGLRLALAILLLAGTPAGAQTPSTPAPEVVTAIRVHGNHTTPDAEVVRIAGVSVGQPFTPATLDEVGRRLRDSHRFRSVEVRKRYESIADPSAVLLVILVVERAGIAVGAPSPGPLRRLGANTMWLPVLQFEDGYGFTYGARLAFPGAFGHNSRVSVPLTWGGERQAAVTAERTFERGPFTRLLATGGVWRRENPAYDTAERRAGASVRAERTFAPWLRVGGEAAGDDVAFGETSDRLRRLTADALVDTRRDPILPRHAVFAEAAIDRLWFAHGDPVTRTRLDLRGYLGLPGRLVLAVRGQHVGASGPLPPWEQALLGGVASLRGFQYGYKAGDQLAALSAELRHSLSSPLRLAKLGVAVFTDAGAVYGSGQRLADARFDDGVGGAVFVTAPMLSLRLDVAHGISSGTRAHFTLGVRF